MLRALSARAKGWVAGEALVRAMRSTTRASAASSRDVATPNLRRAVTGWPGASTPRSATRRAPRTGARSGHRGTRALADAQSAQVREQPRRFARPSWTTICSSTGGTTGIPLPLWRSPRSVAAEQVVPHRDGRPGSGPGARAVAVLRGDDIKAPDDRTPPFWVSRLGGRRLVFSSNHLNRATVADYARALREFRADVWWVYPTTLESLTRLTTEAGLALSVPVILSSSEVLGTAARQAARAAFGARILRPLWPGGARGVGVVRRRRPVSVSVRLFARRAGTGGSRRRVAARDRGDFALE